MASKSAGWPARGIGVLEAKNCSIAAPPGLFYISVMMKPGATVLARMP